MLTYIIVFTDRFSFPFPFGICDDVERVCVCVQWYGRQSTLLIGIPVANGMPAYDVHVRL